MKTEKQSVLANGGKRPGAGRKVGVPNKRTQELQDAVASTGITPLDYMLQVMRDENAEEKSRLNAAISAAPYVHAKLASIEFNGKMEVSPMQSLLDSISGTSLKVVRNDE